MAQSKANVPSNIPNECEGCKANVTCYYCSDCPMALCQGCAVPHRNVKATATHTLTQVEDMYYELTRAFASGVNELTGASSNIEQSIPRSGDDSVLNIPCSEHNTLFVKWICKTCEAVLCDSCKLSHRGHEIIDPKSDLGLLHRIAVSTIVKLSKYISQIDTATSDTKGSIIFYLDVKKSIENWRRVIVECANKSADSLQSQIDQQVTKLESMLNENTGDLVLDRPKGESLLSKLNIMNDVEDPDAILAAISEGNILLKEGERIITNAHVLAKTRNIEHLFPHLDVLDPLQRYIKKFFTMLLDVNDSESADGRVAEYKKQKIVQDVPINTQYCLKICENSNSGNILTLYAESTTDIIELNTETLTQTQYKSDVNLQTLVSVSTTRYVAKQCYQSEVFILDSAFKIIKKKGHEKGRLHRYDIVDICLFSKNTFVECSRTSTPSPTLRFSKVSVENDNFKATLLANIDIDLTPKFTRLHHNIRGVTLVTDGALHKVDLTTSAIASQDISSHGLSNVWSLYVDEFDNTLIGYGSGKLHVYSPTMEHGVLHYIGKSIYGIALHNDRLVLSCDKGARIKLFR